MKSGEQKTNQPNLCIPLKYAPAADFMLFTDMCVLTCFLKNAKVDDTCQFNPKFLLSQSIKHLSNSFLQTHTEIPLRSLLYPTSFNLFLLSYRPHFYSEIFILDYNGQSTHRGCPDKLRDNNPCYRYGYRFKHYRSYTTNCHTHF